jgi:hypothetical protein
VKNLIVSFLRIPFIVAGALATLLYRRLVR